MIKQLIRGIPALIVSYLLLVMSGNASYAIQLAAAPPTTAGEIPSTTLPGRLQQTKPQIPKKEDIPQVEIIDEIEEKIEEEQRLKKKKPPEEEPKEEYKIYLDEIIIEGADSIPKCELQQLYLKLIGNKVTIKELKDLAQNIENHYRTKGYILARVILPQQKIKQEKAKIKFIILEGKIAKINITGKPGRNLKIINKYLQLITEAKAITLKLLEEKLLLVNDIPGINIKSFISASKTVIGAADLNIKVEPNRTSGYYTLDNRGTKYIGNKQLLVGANFFSLLAADNLYTDILKPIPEANQITSFTGLYKLFFGSSGSNCVFTYKKTITRPGEELRIIQLEGDSAKMDFMVNKPLIRTRTKNLYLNAGIYSSNNKNITLLRTFYEDKIRAGYIGANFSKIFENSILNINLTCTKGMIFGSAKMQDDIELSRERGTGKFFKYNVNIDYTYNLAKNLSLFFGLTGQHSKQNLLSSEEFGYGGEVFGNAYDASEIIGDKGAALKGEVRYNLIQKIPDVNYIQLYTSYDLGKVWNNGENISQESKQSASAICAGIRVSIFKGILASLEVAQPLTKATSADGVKKTRYFGKLTMSF